MNKNCGIGLQFEPSQLSQILVDVQGRATELAQALDFSPESIAQRDALITRSVDSFFASGIRLHRNNKK